MELYSLNAVYQIYCTVVTCTFEVWLASMENMHTLYVIYTCIPPLHNSTTSLCIHVCTTVYIGIYAQYIECSGGIMDLYHNEDLI